jgi:hypothetical protein
MLYKLNFDELTNEDIQKVDKLYDLACDRGFIKRDCGCECPPCDGGEEGGENLPVDGGEVQPTPPVDQEPFNDYGDDGLAEGGKTEDPTKKYTPEELFNLSEGDGEGGEEPKEEPKNEPAPEEPKDDGEKKDDEPNEEPKDDGEEDKPLTDGEKEILKDEYIKLFKSVLLKQELEKSEEDMNPKEKAKFWKDLAASWEKADPEKFLTAKERNDLGKVVMTK